MLTLGSLCSGYGGLELGLAAAGIRTEPVWYSEIDGHAAQVMAAHNPGVSNLGDLTAIGDVPPVDIVTAGFPCQPVSMAGKRKGVNDERWLIDDVCRIARGACAEWLLLENVGGIYSANGGDAFRRVISALAENGFSAVWTCVRASDTGAPHQRLRWFCLGNSNRLAGSAAIASGRGSGQVGESGAVSGIVGPDSPPKPFAADSYGGATGRDSRSAPRTQKLSGRGEPDESDRFTHGASSTTTDSYLPRRGKQRWTIPIPSQQTGLEHAGYIASRFGPYAEAIGRWEPIVGRAAPDPTDEKQRLNPRFVEWMMGLPDGWVTDTVEGRSHQLRILGNGVVPLQAALAVTLLNEHYR